MRARTASLWNLQNFRALVAMTGMLAGSVSVFLATGLDANADSGPGKYGNGHDRRNSGPGHYAPAPRTIPAPPRHVPLPVPPGHVTLPRNPAPVVITRPAPAPAPVVIVRPAPQPLPPSPVVVGGGHGRINRNECLWGLEGTKGRQIGERNATALFNRMWDRLGRRCDTLDMLAGLLAETPLSRPTTRGAFQACFYQGYAEALFDNLGQASERCANRCFNAGSEIGRISAEGYCAASMALGGLDDPGFIRQPELPLCGFHVVMGCKSQYINTALFEINECRVYTEGHFRQVFDNSVRQDCYVPSDVPIRDQSIARLF